MIRAGDDGLTDTGLDRMLMSLVVQNDFLHLCIRAWLGECLSGEGHDSISKNCGEWLRVAKTEFLHLL